MKLYSEVKNEKFAKLFELNNETKQRKILYMLENDKLINLMLKKIKKNKSISIINSKKVSSISSSGLLKSVKFNNKSFKYNLVIICTGHNSDLTKNIFNDGVIENSYEESAITTILKHSPLKNNTVRQIFLDKGILAFLPISNTKTSIVWSLKNNFEKKGDYFLKRRIKFYAKNYLKNIKFSNSLSCKNLNFVIRKKYYVDRTLLLGDALHVIHPFVGQGFNMTLRDLISLKKILIKKINLGLDIGSSDILSEFSDEIKPRNFIFSMGVDILKNSFSHKRLRNNVLKSLNKNNLAKDIFFNIADEGLRF